jgi:hypothetical protein
MTDFTIANDIFTISEAAKFIGKTSPKRIRMLVLSGVLPATKISEKKYLICKKDLLKFFDIQV